MPYIHDMISICVFQRSHLFGFNSAVLSSFKLNFENERRENSMRDFSDLVYFRLLISRQADEEKKNSIVLASHQLPLLHQSQLKLTASCLLTITDWTKSDCFKRDLAIILTQRRNLFCQVVELPDHSSGKRGSQADWNAR